MNKKFVFSSVAVQNDFVRLSQSLQVELEKIRQEETEVILSQSLQEIELGNSALPLN